MDKLLSGLSTTAVGMLVVFFGLTILIACITVMGFIMAGGKKKKKVEKPTEVAAPVQEAPVEEVAEEENDDALIAVISAAVAAMWQDENTGFVVRRIRRYPGQKR